MALFYKNICQFGQCNLEFANVYELIQHIEETHIPLDGEKKPDTQSQVACAPLSAICRYYQKLPEQPARPIIPKPTFQQPSPLIAAGAQAAVKKRVPSIIAQSASGMGPGLVTGGTPSGQPSVLFHAPSCVAPSRSSGTASTSHVSEGEDESMSVGRESFSSESSMAVDDNTGESSPLIKVISPGGSSEERRYVCTVPGCKKTYKNMNGIRYHQKMAHTHAGGATTEVQPNAKKFKCQCGKAYKTSHGLHNHMLQTHHRQAQTTQMTPAAATGAPKFASGMAGVSASPSQFKRGLPVSMMERSGPPTGAATAPKPPSQSMAASYFAQQSAMKSSSGVAGVSSSTTTLPSGVSVQVSNLGSGAPTTVQVGQQGALGSAPPHGLHISAARRLSAMPNHPQHSVGGRMLKVHSYSATATGQPGISAGTSSVTTMGGSGAS